MARKYTYRDEKKIDEIHESVILLKSEILGTEQKEGLVKKVGKNTVHRIQSETKNKIVAGAVGGGWLITIVLLIIQLTS